MRRKVHIIVGHIRTTKNNIIYMIKHWKLSIIIWYLIFAFFRWVNSWAESFIVYGLLYTVDRCKYGWWAIKFIWGRFVERHVQFFEYWNIFSRMEEIWLEIFHLRKISSVGWKPTEDLVFMSCYYIVRMTFWIIAIYILIYLILTLISILTFLIKDLINGPTFIMRTLHSLMDLNSEGWVAFFALWKSEVDRYDPVTFKLKKGHLFKRISDSIKFNGWADTFTEYGASFIRIVRRPLEYLVNIVDILWEHWKSYAVLRWLSFFYIWALIALFDPVVKPLHLEWFWLLEENVSWWNYPHKLEGLRIWSPRELNWTFHYLVENYFAWYEKTIHWYFYDSTSDLRRAEFFKNWPYIWSKLEGYVCFAATFSCFYIGALLSTILVFYFITRPFVWEEGLKKTLDLWVFFIVKFIMCFKRLLLKFNLLDKFNHIIFIIKSKLIKIYRLIKNRLEQIKRYLTRPFSNIYKKIKSFKSKK